MKTKQNSLTHVAALPSLNSGLVKLHPPNDNYNVEFPKGQLTMTVLFFSLRAMGTL